MHYIENKHISGVGENSYFIQQTVSHIYIWDTPLIDSQPSIIPSPTHIDCYHNGADYVLDIIV